MVDKHRTNKCGHLSVFVAKITWPRNNPFSKTKKKKSLKHFIICTAVLQQEWILNTKQTLFFFFLKQISWPHTGKWWTAEDGRFHHGVRVYEEQLSDVTSFSCIISFPVRNGATFWSWVIILLWAVNGVFFCSLCKMSDIFCFLAICSCSFLVRTNSSPFCKFSQIREKHESSATALYTLISLWLVFQTDTQPRLTLSAQV